MSAIGTPEKFIICEPAIDPLPKRVEQPIREPQALPAPEEVPVGDEG